MALVASVEGTIKEVARKFGNGLGKMDMEDLYAAGRIGAVEAAQRYDVDDARGGSFNTYAFFWIRAYVAREIFFFWGKGRTGSASNTQKIFAKYSKAAKAVSVRSDDATIEEIAEEIGVSVGTLHSMIGGEDVSFDHVRGEGMSLRESIPDVSIVDGLKKAIESSEIERIERAIGKLDLREGYVLRQQFIEGKLLREIAPSLKITKARVQQIAESGLRHLREVLKGSAS